MESGQQPSNADIYLKLGNIDATLMEVHTQVKLTNGRVTELEKWRRGVEEVEDYKREQKSQKPAPTPQEQKDGWSVREKQLVAIITTLLAIVGALVGIGTLKT